MMSSNTLSTKHQAVTFAEYSDLVCYHIPIGQDKSSTWYSSKDRHSFRKTMTHDAWKASQEINHLPSGEAMTHDQLTECLGIEMFLVAGTARSAHQARRAHIAAVLSEQTIQRESGICDVERLSSVSKKGSHQSVERARKLAAGYAALVMEWEATVSACHPPTMSPFSHYRPGVQHFDLKPLSPHPTFLH